MKFVPVDLEDNVNVSKISPLKELLLLTVVSLFIVLSVFILLGFAVDYIVPRLPPRFEENLGKVFDSFYSTAGKPVPAEIKLQQLLDKLQAEIPGNKVKYRVKIEVSDQVNAMAVPGGTIIVFSQLVKQAGSENELAFVLGHELGHFAHQDHLKGLGRGLILLVFSSAIFGADSSLSDFFSKQLTRVEMKFSQQQETNADLFGLDLLEKNYGQAAGATDFFRKMLKEEKNSKFAYFFASHPPSETRINVIDRKIKEQGFLIKEKIPLAKDYKVFE
jgi:Zn-dependent protease with chaperone function